MKKALSILVTVAMVVTMFSGSAFADPGNGNGKGKDKMNGFTDLGGHWAEKSVKDLQALGILGGYSDGTFKPDKTLTQGELAVIISRILELKQGDDDQDLEDDDDITVDDEDLPGVPGWAKKAVQKGVKGDYINLKRFHSEQQCSRLFTCVAIARALELDPVPKSEFKNNNPFKDLVFNGEEFTDEDYGYLLAFYRDGYIKGYPDGNFNPNNLLTRGQIASIIDRLLNGDEDVLNDDHEPTWDSDKEVKADEVSATSVRLKWSEADDDIGVVGYKVLYKLDGTNDTEKVKYAAGRTATITGLEPDEDYAFKVEARDAAGNWSDDGPSVVVTTDEATEDSERPTWDSDKEVKATEIRAHSVDLEWSGVDGDDEIVAYKVIIEHNDNKTVENVGDVDSVRLSELKADEEYTFTVEAKDAAGHWSNDGPSVEVKTLDEDTTDTKAPFWSDDEALEITYSGSGIYTVEWPDADDNIGVTDYMFYKDGQLLKTLDGDANKVRLSGLSDDTWYTFTVRAVDAADNVSDLDDSLSEHYLVH